MKGNDCWSCLTILTSRRGPCAFDRTGGAGGQRGLQDIIDQLGTRDFSRLRLGIGRPPGRMEPRAWVLKPLRGDDLIRAQEMAGRAADAVETWLQSGTEAAMTRHNGDGTRASARQTSRVA